jgi:hypothetical protein
MNALAPPKKAPGALASNTGRKLITSIGYYTFDLLQAGTVWAIWQREAERLFVEYWRTGNHRHLRAFFTHVVAMRAYEGGATQ